MTPPSPAACPSCKAEGGVIPDSPAERYCPDPDCRVVSFLITSETGV